MATRGGTASQATRQRRRGRVDNPRGQPPSGDGAVARRESRRDTDDGGSLPWHGQGVADEQYHGPARAGRGTWKPGVGVEAGLEANVDNSRAWRGCWHDSVAGAGPGVLLVAASHEPSWPPCEAASRRRALKGGTRAGGGGNAESVRHDKRIMAADPAGAVDAWFGAASGNGSWPPPGTVVLAGCRQQALEAQPRRNTLLGTEYSVPIAVMLPSCVRALGHPTSRGGGACTWPCTGYLGPARRAPCQCVVPRRRRGSPSRVGDAQRAWAVAAERASYPVPATPLSGLRTSESVAADVFLQPALLPWLICLALFASSTLPLSRPVATRHVARRVVIGILLARCSHSRPISSQLPGSPASLLCWSPRRLHLPAAPVRRDEAFLRFASPDDGRGLVAVSSFSASVRCLVSTCTGCSRGRPKAQPAPRRTPGLRCGRPTAATSPSP
ncbi:hypothetical protein TCAP_03884 [Tolypocladium capitatum]|uniref:Uncharacterized protein n=1 Tax=Tolypocladium capitatum TaxID=45235 RepID=A0A2K3QF70_9HYPO|nr:hypothetical protein TCAP_03884 [Tolypocladium capitatum]